VKLLEFNHKTITTLEIDGKTQPFYRQAPHPTRSSTKGKWMPFDGFTPCLGKGIPVTPDTRKYWLGQDPKLDPGYGSKKLEQAAKSLDRQNLPEGTPTNDVRKANLFLGTQHGRRLNEAFDRLDRQLNSREQESIQVRIDHGTEQQKHAQKEFSRNPFFQNLLDLSVRLGKERLSSPLKKAMVPAKTALAILIIQPMLGLGDLKASDPRAESSHAKERIAEAYDHLQNMSGKQIKELLLAIPEKQRVELTKFLPNGVIPGFIPDHLAAKGVGLAPPSEIKKGFQRMDEKEFAQASALLPAATKNQLFKLLLETAKPRAKNLENEKSLEPIQG